MAPGAVLPVRVAPRGDCACALATRSQPPAAPAKTRGLSSARPGIALLSRAVAHREPGGPDQGVSRALAAEREEAGAPVVGDIARFTPGPALARPPTCRVVARKEARAISWSPPLPTNH